MVPSWEQAEPFQLPNLSVCFDHGPFVVVAVAVRVELVKVAVLCGEGGKERLERCDHNGRRQEREIYRF